VTLRENGSYGENDKKGKPELNGILEFVFVQCKTVPPLGNETVHRDNNRASVKFARGKMRGLLINFILLKQ
jgi:hypothetical protein